MRPPSRRIGRPKFATSGRPRPRVRTMRPTSWTAWLPAWHGPTSACRSWSPSCATADADQRPQEFAWLADSETPALVRNNMRLYYARWLVQAGYYDEAIAWTDGLKTDDVVAPATLLFYRAAALHQVVEPDQANAAVVRLLERPDDVPRRYLKLALLMQQDLAGLEDESLDHIARRMSDIRRRLALGRAGRKSAGRRTRRRRFARQDDQRPRRPNAADSRPMPRPPVASPAARRCKTASMPNSRVRARWSSATSATRPTGATCPRKIASSSARHRPRVSLPLPGNHRAVLPPPGKRRGDCGRPGVRTVRKSGSP